MRASGVLQATWLRVRRPRTWGAALLFGLVWSLSRLLLGLPVTGLWELSLPTLWLVGALVLAPVPWQWTGTPAPMAGPLRGGLQALPWMAGLTVLLLLALGPASPEPRAHGRGPGGGRMGRMELRGPARSEPGFGREPLSPVSPGLEGPRRLWPLHPRLWLLGLTYGSLGLLLGWLLADRERAEFQEHLARQAADQARISALQNQMNPHVLFNAISGLTELVREDPLGAEQALVNLADLLRRLMVHGARLRAPLGDEHRVVELQLAMERLRLGPRLQETWDWPADLDVLELPPLLIQPLIENALKHGVAAAVGGGRLAVKVSREGTDLCIRVANTGPAPVDAAQNQGTGLRNLRERLGLLGAPVEALTLSRDGEWTVAELRIAVTP